MAGHPTGDWVDRVRDLDPAFLELTGEFTHFVLSLSRCQSIARNDDDLAGIGQLKRHVVYSD